MKSADERARQSEVIPSEPWAHWVDDSCRAIVDGGRWRSLRAFDAAGPRGRLLTNKGTPAHEVVSFASNDYLGLTQHPAVKAAAIEATERWGTGSGSARLVVGSRPIHHELETALAAWRTTEAALIFPTGFSANLSVLATFGGPDVRIFSDELNHASIIDGTRLARAEVAIYRHRDLDHLSSLLETARSDSVGRTIIVTDSVFSMDGDLAPLDEIVSLAANYQSLLVVDEAHDLLSPPRDFGACATLRVGTMSKALGSLGGFVAGPQQFIDLLINAARPFIFTTAPTPGDTAAAIAAVRIVSSTEGDKLRATLRSHIEQVAPGHPSPVIPIVIGDEHEAVAASASLLDRGLLVPAIRPPTVPVGTSRLRVALSAAHTAEQIRDLIDGLNQLASSPR